MSTQRMMAINELYMSSPSIQAARAILQGQLLSSGIKLRRKGEDVELEEAFQKHLQAYWLPFAKDVIDHFLQFGFCVVAIDQQEPEPFSGFKKFGKQTVENYARQEAGDAAAKRRKGLNGLSAPVRPQGSAVVAALQAPKKEENLIPFVPSLGTYEVSFVMGGRIQSSSRRIRLRAPRLAIRNDSFDRGGRFEGGCRNARLGHHEDR